MGPEDAEEDEMELFRRAMHDVQPLKRSSRALAPKRRVSSRTRRARMEREALLDEPIAMGADLYELQPGQELSFRRTGVSELVLRRLRRGHYRVEAEIDLHGLTAKEAAAQLGAYLREALSRHLRCVRVIHGKGLRSGTRGPVVKNTVNALLRRADAVLAFVSAPVTSGGTGATLVLLARTP